MANFCNIYTALLLVLAKATNKELARYVSFLKAENHRICSSNLAFAQGGGSIFHSVNQPVNARLLNFSKRAVSDHTLPDQVNQILAMANLPCNVSKC